MRSITRCWAEEETKDASPPVPIVIFLCPELYQDEHSELRRELRNVLQKHWQRLQDKEAERNNVFLAPLQVGSQNLKKPSSMVLKTSRCPMLSPAKMSHHS